MKPIRLRYRFHDQQSLISEDEQELRENFKDECALEKHRRFHYLKRREEEERQNRDNL